MIGWPEIVHVKSKGLDFSSWMAGKQGAALLVWVMGSNSRVGLSISPTLN